MIGYYLHHQGEGHRRRGTAVARALRQPVTGLGSGQAPAGWPGDWVELERDDQPPVRVGVGADVTAGGVLHWAPLRHTGLAGRHHQIVTWLHRAQPSLVVVDVSVEVALLVRLCGVPVVVGALPGDRLDRAHRSAYDLATALLAPWPPGAHPDAGWPERWRRKTWEVGGISALAVAGRDDGDDQRVEGNSAPGDAPVARTGAPAQDRRVLVVWGSGGDPLSAWQVRAAAHATPGWTWTVRGGGWPASPDLVRDLAAADVVVGHAGQGAVADLAGAGRPAVVLAQPRPHDEQDATARALDRLRIAVTGRGWPSPEEWPGLLGRALSLGGQGWSRWGADGARRAAGLLDTLAVRGTVPDTAPETVGVAAGGAG